MKVATDATPDISFTDIIREVQTNIQESGAGQTVELVDRLNHPYYIKRFVQSILQSVKNNLLSLLHDCDINFIYRNTTMAAFQDETNKYYRAVQQWISDSERLIQEIKMIIENLKAQHRKVNIARYTGATATVGGGAMVAVGLILLPFTIGGSTALLVGGAATATAGGSAIAAATIVDEIIKK